MHDRILPDSPFCWQAYYIYYSITRMKIILKTEKILLKF